MTWALFLDTAICGAAVGFAQLSHTVSGLSWFQHVNSVADSARRLPDLVEEGLNSCGITVSDVDAIVIATGPGSFTGIRVGLAYAYGFAVGIEAKRKSPMRWLGVSSLSLLAAKYTQADGLKSMLLGATASTGYAAIRRYDNIELVSWRSDDATAVDELVKSGPIGIIGNWPKVEQDFRARGAEYQLIPVGESIQTAMSEMVALARQIQPNSFDRMVPVPVYLRRSTVEEASSGTQK